MVGDGDLFSGHESLISRLGLTDRIELIRQVLPDQIRYMDYDIFVLSSVSEGMPLSLLEAMAHGLPCLVSDVPGLNDLILSGTTGEILGVDSQFDSLIERIAARWSEYSFNSRAAAETNYDLASSVAKLVAACRPPVK